MELGLRQALFQDGRHLLEELLKDAGRDLPGTQPQPGEKCHPQRRKEVQTLFGAIQIRRDYFYDPAQGRVRRRQDHRWQHGRPDAGLRDRHPRHQGALIQVG